MYSVKNSISSINPLQLSLKSRKSTGSAQTTKQTTARDILTCFLCQNIFKEPMILNCGHSFCLKCVDKWLRKCTNCPACRMPTLQPIHNITLKEMLVEFEKAEKENMNAFQRSIAQPLMRSLRSHRRGTLSNEAKSLQRETIRASERIPKEFRFQSNNKLLAPSDIESSECSVEEIKGLRKITLNSNANKMLETSFYDKNENDIDTKQQCENKKETSNVEDYDETIIIQNNEIDNIVTSKNNLTKQLNDNKLNDMNDMQRSFSRLRQKISYKVNTVDHMPTPPPSQIKTSRIAQNEHNNAIYLRKLTDNLSNAYENSQNINLELNEGTDLVATKNILESIPNRMKKKNTICPPKIKEEIHYLTCLKSKQSEIEDIETYDPNDSDASEHTSSGYNTNQQSRTPTPFSTKCENDIKDQKTERCVTDDTNDCDFSNNSKSDGNMTRKCTDYSHHCPKSAINFNSVSLLVVSSVDSSELLYHMILQAFAINFGCVEFAEPNDIVSPSSMVIRRALLSELIVFTFSSQDSSSIDDMLKIFRTSHIAKILKDKYFVLINIKDNNYEPYDHRQLLELVDFDRFYEINAENLFNEIFNIVEKVVYMNKSSENVSSHNDNMAGEQNLRRVISKEDFINKNVDKSDSTKTPTRNKKSQCLIM